MSNLPQNCPPLYRHTCGLSFCCCYSLSLSFYLYIYLFSLSLSLTRNQNQTKNFTDKSMFPNPLLSHSVWSNQSHKTDLIQSEWKRATQTQLSLSLLNDHVSDKYSIYLCFFFKILLYLTQKWSTSILKKCWNENTQIITTLFPLNRRVNLFKIHFHPFVTPFPYLLWSPCCTFTQLLRQLVSHHHHHHHRFVYLQAINFLSMCYNMLFNRDIQNYKFSA